MSGSMFKIVQCESCRFVYVYRMTRTGAGSASESVFADGGAVDEAAAYASFDLQQKLAHDCDAVPCLECGKYQQHMIDALKRDFQSGQWYTGIILLLLAVILAAIYGILMSGPRHIEKPDWTLGALAALAGVSGATMLLLRRYQLRHFDPHATDVAERMKIARKYARTLDEFREYLAYHGIEWHLPKY
jgi:hypothetical protein